MVVAVREVVKAAVREAVETVLAAQGVERGRVRTERGEAEATGQGRLERVAAVKVGVARVEARVVERAAERAAEMVAVAREVVTAAAATVAVRVAVATEAARAVAARGRRSARSR